MKLPTRDTRRVLRIVYVDGEGVLRRILSVATEIGFSALILSTSKREKSNLVEVDVRFKGKPALDILMPKLHDVDGVQEVFVFDDDTDDEESSAA